MLQNIGRIFEGVSAVIFDLDGTLVDSVEAQAWSWRDVLSECGHRFEPDFVRSLLGLEPAELIRRAIGPVATSEAEAINERRVEIFLEDHLSQVQPLGSAKELLALLRSRGIVTLLATSANRDERRALLASGGLQGQFPAGQEERFRLGSDRLLSSLRGHVFEPGQCMVVGDTMHDCQAAAQAGMRFLGVQSGGWEGRALSNVSSMVANVA